MKKKRGFTLVEILIVVLILGILGAVVIPKFSTASATARASMLADDLRIIRSQVMVFKGQHAGVSPGYPGLDSGVAPTEGAFVLHMTKSSTPAGATAEPGTSGFPYGPYMREMPINPVNDKNTVEIIADGGTVPAVADDSHGWIFQPSTLIFKADCTGTNDLGKAYIDY